MKEEKEIWFKQRKLGLGWTPCTREGWFVVVAYLIFLFFITFDKIEEDKLDFNENLFDFFIPFFIATALLIYVSWLKGEKLEWRRWGKIKDVDK